jgi:transposase
MMTVREAERLATIKQVKNKKLRQREASEILGLSLRQTQRLIRSYKDHGAEGLISKKRGKPNVRKTTEKDRIKIIARIKEKYSDFGPTFASEKLKKEEGITISRETLRKFMIEEGLWKPKKRKEKQVHQRRARRSQEGELVQADGSYHDWFEGRAPKCCLIQFVDDATSKILYAKFCEWESTNNYFECLEGYLKKHGKPQALYVDKHSVFKVTREELKKGQGITVFHKALNTLGIKLICANSPQAKGRVERKNGVLQDRLIKEMRLKKISSIAEANQYLEEEFIDEDNKQFGKPPADPINGHKPLSPKENLEEILTTQNERTVSKNLTIQYNNRIYQLKTTTPNRMKYKKVTTIEKAGNPLVIKFQGKEVPYDIWEEYKYQGPKTVDDKELESTWERKSA